MMDDQKLDELRNYVRERAGQRLSGERELAQLLVISRPRLRALLEKLEQEGAVQRRQGSGTYAVARDARRLRRVVILLDANLKLGDDPFVSRLVELLQKELQESGVQCLIQRISDGEAPLQNCDGVLALGSDSIKSIDAPLANSLPTVGLFAPQSARHGRRMSLLELDDEEAGSKAARRLLDCQVEHIYFCGRQDLNVVKERLSGVEKELALALIPFQFFECGLNYAAGLQLGMQLVLPPQTRVGIIAANDWLALGLHTGLQSANPASRGQVQLVSFDGLPITASSQLAIKSLAVPLEAMAADAVAELQNLKNPRSVGRTIRYSLEFAGSE